MFCKYLKIDPTESRKGERNIAARAIASPKYLPASTTALSQALGRNGLYIPSEKSVQVELRAELKLVERIKSNWLDLMLAQHGARAQRYLFNEAEWSQISITSRINADFGEIHPYQNALIACFVFG